MRSIDLESLHIFKAVVECGSVTRAAARLHRVQSNVTTRIRRLEERLGVQLFLRQGGRLNLSAEGRLLLGYADRLLNLSNEAESALRSRAPGGLLRVGTMESTAAARLPPLLSAYHRHFPQVRIELVTGTSAALVSKVQALELDAAFVARPFAEHGLASHCAFLEELVLVTPPGISPSTGLHGCTLIAFSSGCSYRRIVEDWLRAEGVLPERVLELGSYHAIVACVAAGTGVAIVPRSVLATLRAQPEVGLHPLPPAFGHAETHLIWSEGHDSPALAALRAALPA